MFPRRFADGALNDIAMHDLHVGAVDAILTDVAVA